MLMVTFLAFVCRALGHYASYDYGFNTHTLLRRQVSPNVLVVKGAAVVDNHSIPVRKEIRELQQNQEQWTLYLLGLNMMQFANQSDPTSWYGLTGIHGVPFQTWGGVGPTSGNERSGYCTHISVLFPTWHRPYLALYEVMCEEDIEETVVQTQLVDWSADAEQQTLQYLVQRIAGYWPEGPERQRFQRAAVTFRIPYWDSASKPIIGHSVFPASAGDRPYVDIVGPRGKQRIANPLYSYGFNPFNSTAFIQSPFTDWTSTLRAPTSHDDSAQSNNSIVARILDQNRAGVEQRVYNLFANYDNYSTFSNEGWIPQNNNGTYDSLESIHDTIHNMAGGFTGHMSYIPFSAFDPIFFLHHANVDRLFAMWQVLYPDSWILPTPAAMSSYTTSRGEIQDASTALTPFYADEKGNFWTSDMVRDHTIFGYTYADIAGPAAAGKLPATNKSHVISTINRLYGQSSLSRFAMNAETSASKWRPPIVKLLAGNQYREWIANIRVQKQALGGPFSIHIFSGDAPISVSDWFYASNLMGTMSMFAMPLDEDIHMQGDQLVSGTIPLTAYLVKQVDAGILRSLDVADTGPFLRKTLRYRIATADGEHTASVNGLGIHITSHLVQAPTRQDQLPKWISADTIFELI